MEKQLFLSARMNTFGPCPAPGHRTAAGKTPITAIPAGQAKTAQRHKAGPSIFRQEHFSNDISKFFKTIDHGILKAMFSGKFKNPDPLWFLHTIIDAPQSVVPEKDIPIGNLTS